MISTVGSVLHLKYIYFGTGPLQCLRDVPQRLKVLILYIITVDLMQ